MAGLKVKMRGEENVWAAAVPFGLSPDPQGLFLNSCAFLSQVERHMAITAERRKSSSLRKNLGSGISEAQS